MTCQSSHSFGEHSALVWPPNKERESERERERDRDWGRKENARGAYLIIVYRQDEQQKHKTLLGQLIM